MVRMIIIKLEPSLAVVGGVASCILCAWGAQRAIRF